MKIRGGFSFLPPLTFAEGVAVFVFGKLFRRLDSPQESLLFSVVPIWPVSRSKPLTEPALCRPTSSAISLCLIDEIALYPHAYLHLLCWSWPRIIDGSCAPGATTKKFAHGLPPAGRQPMGNYFG